MSVKLEINKAQLEKTIREAANKKLNKMKMSCPHCHNFFPAVKGKNVCPFCKREITVS